MDINGDGIWNQRNIPEDNCTPTPPKKHLPKAKQYQKALQNSITQQTNSSQQHIQQQQNITTDNNQYLTYYVNGPERLMSVATGLPIFDVLTWGDINFLSSDYKSLLPNTWLEKGIIDLFSIIDTQMNPTIYYIPSETYEAYKRSTATGDHHPILFQQPSSHAIKMLSMDMWIFMLNDNNLHWKLLCVTHPGTKQPKVLLLDSMTNHLSNPSFLEVFVLKSFVQYYINNVTIAAQRLPFTLEDNCFKTCYVPVQPNGNDCGVFALFNLQFIIKNFIHVINSATNDERMNFLHWYDPFEGVAYRDTLFYRYGSLLDQYSIPVED
jgi:hypothetical protein